MKFTIWRYYAFKFFVCTFSVLFFSHFIYAQQGIDDTVTASVSGSFGYYASKPLDYNANPTKKYPLLITLQGNSEQGNGSLAQLPRLFNASGGIPSLLNANNFPSQFIVGVDTFSFIVVCPQYSGTFTSKAFINYLKTQYRIDSTRIYYTGLSDGGSKCWHNIGSTSTYLGPDSIAAMVLVAPSLTLSYYQTGSTFISRANTSNLPLWVNRNTSEPNAAVIYSVDSIPTNVNALSPAPSPLVKRQIFTSAAGHNAWARTYDPANIIDTANGYNIYQWMLQFTNRKLVAKAGKDTTITAPADSVTLNGSKSTVRRGRIDSVQWSKVSGPATFTITSSTSLVTAVTGLVAGTYQFELKLGHSADTTTARDTVTVIVNGDTTTQTQTKVTQNVSTNIKGYLQSLPVSYDGDTTKKFPLIIALHGEEGKGSGSSAALDTLAQEGIPKLIRDGDFPSTFTLKNGQSYSFIVVSPQFNSSTPSNPHTQLNTLLNYLKANLRVDVERVYVAGQGIGGGIGYSFLVGGTTTTNVGFVDSIAAFAGAGSNIPSMNAARWARIVQSNLPQWLTHNNADPVIPVSRSTSTVNAYNADPLTPSPLAKLTLFSSSLQDSWTTTFDPNYILDSANDYNMYEWMLQYTNKRMVANAGEDITLILPDSDTALDGRNSVARGGRISSYSWSQITGTTVTIASPSSAVTAVSGFSSTGTYRFVLTTTHDSSFTATDTVTITVTNSSPRLAPTEPKTIQQQSQLEEMLSAKINPTIVQSQLTIVIAGRAFGKVNLQISAMDGKRLQRQSFVKDAASMTRTVNVGSLPAGTYIVDVVVEGKHRKVLRFIKQ